MLTNEEIVTQSGVQPSQCDCNECVSMCHKAPCLGTPQDIAKLYWMGYGKHLATIIVASPEVVKYFGNPVEVIGIEFDNEKGHCCMLKDGKCMLHDKGIKPLEGKLANHSLEDKGVKVSPTLLILAQWIQVNNAKY